MMSDLTQSSRERAARFGALVRERRQAMGLRQDDLALATGVGRRFVIDLEAGKATCQLGKALVVAAAVGVRINELARGDEDEDLLIPDAPDEEEGGDGG
jgi:y4mF family transcriptional regulator